jgi:stress response protein YsnF
MTGQTDRADVLPLVEERLVVDRRRTGGVVRVRTDTEAVDEIAAIDLESQEVEVSRVPVGRVVEGPQPVRTEGDLTVIPLVEERMVVTTELVLVEEIHIRRRVTRERVEHPVTLRRQTAVVERDIQNDPDQEGNGR